MFGLTNLPIFTYAKIGLGVAVIVAGAFLYVSWRSAEASLKVAEAAVLQRDAQIATLTAAAAEQRRLDAWEAEDRVAAAVAAEKVDAKKKLVAAELAAAKRRNADAARTEKDGPASPVLVDSAVALRGLYRTKIVPACDNRPSATAENGDTGGDVACAAVEALVPTPVWQSEYSGVTLRFGEAYFECAEQLRGIAQLQRDHNARVDAFNSAKR